MVNRPTDLLCRFCPNPIFYPTYPGFCMALPQDKSSTHSDPGQDLRASMSNLALHILRKRRRRKVAELPAVGASLAHDAPADGTPVSDAAPLLQLPPLDPDLIRIFSRHGAFLDPEKFLKDHAAAKRMHGGSLPKVDELSLPSLVTQGGTSYASSRHGCGRASAATRHQHVQKKVIKGKEVSMVFPSIVKHFRRALSRCSSRRAGRTQEPTSGHNGSTVHGANLVQSRESENQRRHEDQEEGESKASLPSLPALPSARGYNIDKESGVSTELSGQYSEMWDEYNNQMSSTSSSTTSFTAVLATTFSEFTACQRPREVFARGGQEYEARRARALQKQLRTRQANERRYRAAIYEKEQRRLRRLRLETSRRQQRAWMQVIKTCIMLRTHAKLFTWLRDEKAEREREKRARLVIYRSLIRSRLAIAYRMAKSFKRMLGKSLWLFVLWIRTFRRRYAVKKLVPFLRVGMMVYMSARAKRVVRTLFRQLRVMQTFARGFLLCTNSRMEALTRLWEQVQADYHRELAKRIEANNLMRPLDKVSRRDDPILASIVDSVNMGIERWIDRDAEYQELIKKEEARGRIVQKIRGLGALPSIPDKIRDSLLRRLIITRRQAYRQAVYDQAQKVMQANRTGKRFDVEDVKRILFRSDGVQAYRPDQALGTSLAPPKYFFYTATSYGQLDIKPVVRRLYIREFKRLFGDLAKPQARVRGPPSAIVDNPAAAVCANLEDDPRKLPMPSFPPELYESSVAGSEDGGARRKSGLHGMKKLGPKGPELIEITL